MSHCIIPNIHISGVHVNTAADNLTFLCYIDFPAVFGVVTMLRSVFGSQLLSNLAKKMSPLFSEM